MSTDDSYLSPNEALALEVVAALRSAGLVSDNQQQDVEAKLKSGGASEDDWGRWIQATTSPAPNHGDTDEQANNEG